MVAVVDAGAARGGEIALVNVHLRPPLAMGDYLTKPTSTYSFRGIKHTIYEVGAHAWAYLYKAGQVHVQELRHLLSPAVLSGDGNTGMKTSTRAPPVFVVGDFNEGYWGAGCQCHDLHIHTHKFL